MQAEVQQKRQELSQVVEACAKTLADIAGIQAAIDDRLQALFAPLCRKLGIASIGSVDHDRAAVAKEMAEAREAFNNIHMRLAMRLASVGSQVASVDSRIAELVGQAESDRGLLRECDGLVESLQAEHRSRSVQHERAAKEHEDCRALLAACDARVADVQSALLAAQQRMVLVAKELGMAEVEVERLLRDRETILEKCAVEEIGIALSSGCLSSGNWKVPSCLLTHRTSWLIMASWAKRCATGWTRAGSIRSCRAAASSWAGSRATWTR